MTTERKWLLIGGAVAAVAVAFALGVPLGTILIVALLLLCPAAMYFGMRGGETKEQSGRANKKTYSDTSDPERDRKAR